VFCCFWVAGGCFVFVVCGVCCLIYFWGLGDDKGVWCVSSSLSSSLSLWAKRLLGLAGLRLTL
jgi:hypothetical protein